MKVQFRKVRAISILALGLVMALSFVPKTTHADTVTSTDFQSQSFSKVVDWYDYVRRYASANGFMPPNSTEHAYIYANYINVGGFQLFSAGLVNVTHNDVNFVTIPLQTFFEHYKTPGGKDVITASSFISLVAFRENSTTDIYTNSPDKGDEIYASFSLGVNLTALTGHKMPSPVSAATTIPLKSIDSNHYSWGLKYTNLNAMWWKVNPDPLFPCCVPSTPRGLAQYTELTFNYALAIEPNSKTATLTTSYTVGRITDLWIITSSPAVHMNSTGTYNLDGTARNSTTVYQYMTAKQLRLSIVLSQKAIIAGTTTTNKDDSGASVDGDSSTDVSHTAVNTAAGDGERTFRADFGVKPTYNLYNYTSDPGEATASTYNVNVRTVNRAGWGGNPVFWFQNAFMGFLPLFVAHVDPGLIQQAKTGMVSFSVTDYLYIISYPTWGGYRIVNDPAYTAYYQPASNLGFLTAIFIAVAVAAGVGGVFAFLFRRRRAESMTMVGPTGPAPNQPPGPVSSPPGPTQ
ncbi:MAG TPA: hypothetical protein VNA15_10160 [Candidatus Angelobacter sp.]|nr:hypothetical protein [Candidatus Angelobacter sp.]